MVQQYVKLNPKRRSMLDSSCSVTPLVELELLSSTFFNMRLNCLSDLHILSPRTLRFSLWPYDWKYTDVIGEIKSDNHILYHHPLGRLSQLLRLLIHFVKESTCSQRYFLSILSITSYTAPASTPYYTLICYCIIPLSSDLLGLIPSAARFCCGNDVRLFVCHSMTFLFQEDWAFLLETQWPFSNFFFFFHLYLFSPAPRCFYF